MKRDLTPLTFQTAILCQRIGTLKEGFYSSMKERHFYDASNFELLDKVWLETNTPDALATDSSESLTNLKSCIADSDVQADAPICIGMDYNANINWIVAGQPSGNRLNVIKSFYTKFERKIPALIADFCNYYRTHNNKTVVYYYDTTALGSNYAVNEQDFHWVVCDEFEKHGWQVIDVYIGTPMKHKEKHLDINEAFAGRRRLTPYFNRQNNEDLILAMQTAGIEIGRNGFKKNKAGEKFGETEDDLLEHRTDGTDAFDTLYIGCAKFPQENTAAIFVSGVL